MPTTTWNAAFTHSVVFADGSQRLFVQFTDAADGHVIETVTYVVAADGSSVKDERTGSVVASPAPAALVNAGASYATQVAAIVTNGVNGGKIKP